MLAVKEKKKISKTSVNFVKRSGAVLIFFTRYIPERDCNTFWEQLKVLTVYVLDVSSEAATRGVLCKKVFLEILKNSQENTFARVSFLIKLQA